MSHASRFLAPIHVLILISRSNISASSIYLDTSVYEGMLGQTYSAGMLKINERQSDVSVDAKQMIYIHV